ncbi:MAG: energy transducer TonB [Cyclobacteriaceae bacterium]
MKEKVVKNINLSFPCSEDWDSMERKGKGRLCEKCSNFVYDLTEISSTALDELLTNSEGIVCGGFKKSQLSSGFLKYATTAVLAASSLAINAQDLVPTVADSLVKSDEQEEVLFGMIFEEQPEFEGGIQVFYKRLYSKLGNPDEMDNPNKVFIQFEVDTTGEIIAAEVIKGVNPQIDTKALNAFLSLDEKLEPGKQRGKPVKVRMVLPVIIYSENSINTEQKKR